MTERGGAPSFASIKFAKIQFADRRTASRALVGLAARGRVTVLADHIFLVPQAALAWLDEQALDYRVLESLNHDHVVQTLRDHPAHAA